MEKTINFKHPQLGEIIGTSVPFEIVKEDWNRYKLEDGTIVSLRLIVSDIIKTDNKLPNGEPVVAVKSTTIISLDGKV